MGFWCGGVGFGHFVVYSSVECGSGGVESGEGREDGGVGKWRWWVCGVLVQAP